MSDEPSNMVRLHALMHGGVLNKPEIAMKVAELLALNVYGEDSVAPQRPLSIRDDGDRWTIEGSYNRQRKGDDWGPLLVVLKKDDAQVLELEIPMIMTVPDEVKAILKAARQRQAEATPPTPKPQPRPSLGPAPWPK